MKKVFQLSAILIIVGLTSFSCKTKQQVVAIPGAHAEAVANPAPTVEAISPVVTPAAEEAKPAPKAETISPVTTPPAEEAKPAPKVETISPVTPTVVAPPMEEVKPAPQPVVVSQPEQVRDEKFELDKEEENTQAINQKYHVVVGSFKNRDNAKGLQQTLNNEGNNAVVVVNEHGMYRILIASFATYDEARAKITQISGRFPDAWVLTQKK